MSRAAEARTKIEAALYDTERLCEDIIEGDSYLTIAKRLGISKASLLNWVEAEPDRSQRARAALTVSASTADEQAEDVLRDTTLDPVVRRELAAHYRWRARVRNPREYGDKLQIDQKTEIVNLRSDEIARPRAAIQAQIEEAQRQALPAPPAETKD